MSAAAPGKRCTVVYATRERQYLWTVELAPEATIGDALVAARRAAGPAAGLDARLWDSGPVGVFGEPRGRGEPCADGDRIEIYRPLERDPRARRRERLVGERRKGARGG
ncbi:MAG TPA: RnfH family protein [Steroidobacteraceae bacterium]|nr:RnfH family protein [Steroidobacteraceae bacterium]